MKLVLALNVKQAYHCSSENDKAVLHPTPLSLFLEILTLSCLSRKSATPVTKRHDRGERPPTAGYSEIAPIPSTPRHLSHCIAHPMAEPFHPLMGEELTRVKTLTKPRRC